MSAESDAAFEQWWPTYRDANDVFTSEDEAKWIWDAGRAYEEKRPLDGGGGSVHAVDAGHQRRIGALLSGEELDAIANSLRWHLGEHHLTNDPCHCGACDPINHPKHPLNSGRVEAQKNVSALVHEVRRLQAWQEKALIALAAAQRHLALGKPADSKYIIRLGDK